jgi:SpoVK/Ycf46/Vps4 family AAA+-type ATPase
MHCASVQRATKRRARCSSQRQHFCRLQVLYVPLPPASGRVSILRALTRKTPLAPDVDLEAVGVHPAAGDYSGADLAALVREACVLALKVCTCRDAHHLQSSNAAWQMGPLQHALWQRHPVGAACHT